ncbi:hypothetical protein ACFVHB_00280 [Kitasatospora sp. NPDC127111]|uniref:hypothetical protein n=1 Tax=Kitasatospora sp. NPDC127111 TaxID=3345363 RepID=UPI0036445FF3
MSMVEVYRAYRAAVADVWRDWWATWPLTEPVGLGDVLLAQGDAVRSAGTLADRGVAVEPGRPGRRGDYTYDAAGGVELRFKAAGATDPAFSSVAAAEAGALVRFGAGSGVLVVYRGITTRGLADTRRLAGELVRQYALGRWERELLAVTEAARAESGTVLVAAGGEAAAELSITAAAGAGAPGLADLAGGVALAASRNLGLRWVSGPVTPFYRVVRLRERWLRGVEAEYGPVQPGRGLAGASVPPLLLEEAAEDPRAVLEAVGPAEPGPLPAAG